MLEDNYTSKSKGGVEGSSAEIKPRAWREEEGKRRGLDSHSRKSLEPESGPGDRLWEKATWYT